VTAGGVRRPTGCAEQPPLTLNDPSLREAHGPAGFVSLPWTHPGLRGDGDDDVDALSVSGSTDSIRWFENDGGAPPGFSARILTLEGNGTVWPVDVDQDDDVDILAGVGAWFESVSVVNTTSGELSPLLEPAIDIATPNDILLAYEEHFASECAPMLDFDGKPLRIESRGDVSRDNDSTTTLADGAALLAAPEADVTIGGSLVIPSDASADISGSSVSMVGSADLGDRAVATLTADVPVSVSGRVALGAGSSFLTAPSLNLDGEAVFNERSLSIDLPDPQRAVGVNTFCPSDLDGDGDADVILSMRVRQFKVVLTRTFWLENDGNSPVAFVQRSLPKSLDGDAAEAGDLNGDNHADIVTVDFDNVRWFENDGSADPSFAERTITTDANGPTDTVIADIDGDGDADVLTSSRFNGSIRWYENDGESKPSFTEHGISTTAASVADIVSADLDGDGDADLLAAAKSDGGVFWLENDGTADPRFTERALSMKAAGSVFASDVDGDGDLDALSASSGDGAIQWFENDGASQPLFAEQVVTTQANGVESIVAADVDGDGDADVLAAFQAGSAVRQFDNDGANNPAFGARIVATAAPVASQVAATDLDGDGDVELIAASDGSGLIQLFENALVSELSFGRGSTVQAEADISLVNKALESGEGGELIAGGVISLDRTSFIASSGMAQAPLTASAGAIEPDLGETFTIDGDYDQFFDDGVTGFDTGELRIWLGDGTAPATLYVTGTARLAGPLVVTADSGFEPAVGETFTFLTAGALISAERFDVASLPGLPGDKFLRVMYDAAGPEGPGGSATVIVDTLSEDIDLGEPNAFGVNGAPKGATLADCDGDGLLDLAVVVPNDVNPGTAPGDLIILENAGSVSGVWQGFTGGTTQILVGVNPVDVAAGSRRRLGRGLPWL